MRIDTFLTRIRLARTRGRVQHVIDEGLIRLNRRRVEKHGVDVRPGDTITLPMHGTVRVIRVVQLPTRRGPPAEARACYEELSQTANDSHQADQR